MARERSEGRKTVGWNGPAEEKPQENLSGNAHPGKRLVYLDALKIIAIILVLYNHRATYQLFPEWNTFTFRHIALQGMATLCRCAVPLFFMCSGVTLLKKQEPFPSLLRHRVLRIGIVMILCGLMRYRYMHETETLGVIYLSRLNWFLYAYLAYLLMLPFLRPMAQQMDARLALLFLWLVFIFYTAKGLINHYQVTTSFFSFAPIFATDWSSMCWGIIFPLAGYLIDQYEKELVGRRFLLLLAASVCTLALSVVLVIRDCQLTPGANIGPDQEYFIFAPSCLLFLLAKRYLSFDAEKHPRLCGGLSFLAGLTFGIFLIETHGESIYVINRMLSESGILQGAHAYWVGWISILVQLLWCGTITAVAKKIPGIRKLL